MKPESGGGYRRIVCMTEETTEIIYLLGEQARIVGISGYTVRPPLARKEKPKISAFISAKIDKILELKPDIVLGFSDLQAEIAADLIKAGLDVHIFNQRSVEEIFRVIALVGAMVDASERAAELAAGYRVRIGDALAAAKSLPRRPLVYFEEWGSPMISGIRWVSELIGIAGGDECFPEFTYQQGAKNRIIADPMEVVRRAPDIILGSWCGRRFPVDEVCKRPGWDAIPAVQNGQVFEIKSAEILQPGPACLTDGLDQLRTIIQRWGVEHAGETSDTRRQHAG